MKLLRHPLPLAMGALALGVLATPQARAGDGFIWVRVSVKVIVNPATGQVPSGMSDTLLLAAFDGMNRWLGNTWRGYRLWAVDLDSNRNFKRIGSLNDTTGPGKWYSIDLKNNDTQRGLFEDQAKANKTSFGWNDYAVNIYINDADYSCASFPWSGRDVVISAYNLLRDDLTGGRTGATDYQVGGNLLHEIGHFMGLLHTFDHGYDDDIPDTALDPNVAQVRNETAIRNAIAQLNYSGRNYSNLSASEKIPVDNTANNAMAYYTLWYDDPPVAKVLTDAERYGPTRFVFTELQLDRWAGYANAERSNVTTGSMRFVDAAAQAGGNGTSSAPYNTLAAGISATPSDGDIVLLRPGSYTATTLSKPLTIRVSRPGSAVIRRP